MSYKFKLRQGDEVVVLAGKDKGKTGKITMMKPKVDKAIVIGINKVKKHQKPDNNQAGGIVEKEASIQISNLSLLTSKGETTRIGYKMEEGKKVRFSKKSNEVI